MTTADRYTQEYAVLARDLDHSSIGQVFRYERPDPSTGVVYGRIGAVQDIGHAIWVYLDGVSHFSHLQLQPAERVFLVRAR